MNQGASATIRLDLNDNWTFKSITAWREGDTDTVIDFDNTPLPTLDIPAYYADDQLTQEFQFLFDYDRVQGVAGIFYLDGHAEAPSTPSWAAPASSSAPVARSIPRAGPDSPT